MAEILWSLARWGYLGWAFTLFAMTAPAFGGGGDALGTLPFLAPTIEDLEETWRGDPTLAERVERGWERWQAATLGVDSELPEVTYKGRVHPGFIKGPLASLSPLGRQGLKSDRLHNKGSRAIAGVGEIGAELGLSCSACHARRIGDRVVPGLANPLLDLERLVGLLGTLLRLKTLVAVVQFANPGALATARTAQSKAKEMEDALFQDGCRGSGPGRVPSLRIWSWVREVSRGVRQETPCGFTKIPPLSMLRYRSRIFVDGAINSPNAVRWPLFDIAQIFPSAQNMANLDEEVLKDMEALLKFGTPSLRFDEVMQSDDEPESAAEGFEIFHRSESCASCHGQYFEDGRLIEYQERVIPLPTIGTDPERALGLNASLLEFYEGAEDAFIAVLDSPGSPDFPPGYVAAPLCSPWLNAPFLHTGAVANLEELLRPWRQRRTSWWLGAYTDEESLGFSLSREQASKWRLQQEGVGLRRLTFEVKEVKGHSGVPFGTSLSAHEKRALLDYLKQLHCPLPEEGQYLLPTSNQSEWLYEDL